MNENNTTIAALATPPGRGGIGIIRVSGPQVRAMAKKILGKLPPARLACLTAFKDDQQQTIDEGLALFFPAPHSFTGEDVLELHGHGGPVVLDLLLQRVLALGAHLAQPGEFSRRAFLNNKLDLTQAEAIADLIEASSAQAARAALQSLQGEFSRHIQQLVEQTIHLRMYVEAAIDFVEEEIDFLSANHIATQLHALQQSINALLQRAQQGVLLRDGMTVVIAGQPNVGKSSLLNQLSGRDTAIVTPIAGTTRDIVREHIQIDGLPLQILDTAGIRASSDPVEQEGIRRAQQAIATADRLLWLADITDPLTQLLPPEWQNHPRLTLLQNKIDLYAEQPALMTASPVTIRLSAKTGAGMDLLRQHLKQCMGFQITAIGQFSARRRHITALQQAQHWLDHALTQLNPYPTSELIAEDLRLAQQALSEITGAFTSEDLLTRIFQSFCIGK